MPRAPIQPENFSDGGSEASFAPSDHQELSDAESSPGEILSRSTQSFHEVHNPFSADQLSVIKGGATDGAGGAFAQPTLDSLKWRRTDIDSVATYFEQMIGRFKKRH